MQLIIASMSTKKDSVVVPNVGFTLIVEPTSVAFVALNIAHSIEIEPRANLHMREVSKSPPRPSPRCLAALPRSPSHLQFQGDSSKSSSSSAPT